MSSFALISIEKDYKIDVCEGKITVGRGPFLKITDKRVSRNHATLEVCDGSLTVLPIHTNPTFYQACGESKFTPLEKDEVKKLENGDCISFLPNDLTFRVEKKVTLVVGDTTGEEAFEDKEALEHKESIKHKEIIEHKEILEHKEINEHEAADVSGSKDFECGSKVLEDTDGKDKKVLNVEVSSVEMNKESEGLDSDDDEENDDDDDDDDDEKEDNDRTKIEETARPLNKTRVLPSWMTKNEGKTTKTNVKKDANEVKINKDSVELLGKTKESLEENEDTTNDGNDKKQSNLEDVSVETEEPVKEEEKKRKRDESENEGQSNKREKKLPRCPYGSRCYRKNPVHFQEYSHEEESEESENEEDDDLPECPYGEYCYRKNPRHRREYKHTPQPKTRERKAKKKAGTGKIRDDDEDGPNDYDYEDSFIDDESESNHEASDDSDWQPSGDDDGNDDDGDDVRELLSEARNFTKNKKMLKPT